MKSKSKTEKNTVKHKTKEKSDGKEPKAIVTISEKTLSTFINAVVDCNEEAILNIEPDKLRVSLVDNGNVYMVVTDCECKTDINNGAPDRVGIDFKLLKKTLMYAAGGNVTLAISKNEVGIVYGRFTAKIPTADIPAMRKEPTPPKMQLSTSFEMPGKYLLDACRMVSSGGGRIYIYVKSKVVFIAAHEGDLCMKGVAGTVEKSSQARSLFSNNYLLLIAKSIKDVSAKCEIDIDRPIKISAEKNGCNLTFLLAPRIESN